jgi:hypothetical protein
MVLGSIYAAYMAFLILTASGGPPRTTNIVPLLLFFLWAVSPVVVLAGVAYKFESRSGRAIELMLLGAVCVLALSAAAVYQVGFFGGHPDAQSGLLFVFVPLYQWLAVAVVLVLLAVIARRHCQRRGS